MIRLFVSTCVVGMAAYLLPGVTIASAGAALVTAFVIALLNMFVRPIIVLLTLPTTILTLGAFLFVINALVVLLASRIVPGFRVDGFSQALLFSIIVSLANMMLQPKRRALTPAP